MSQPRVSPDLGPLPRGLWFRAGHRRRHTLVRTLRSLVMKNQREHPRVFYSLREVAMRFKMPVSTVAKIYHDLEQEGLLSRVRSSKTILNGFRNSRRLSVRGLVGLPVLFPKFLSWPDYRTFFNEIHSELWLRGFAPAIVFCQPEEMIDGTLIDRVSSYGTDTIIWLSPGRSAKQSLLRLDDMGVRVVVISEYETPGRPSHYQLWRERGMEIVLREWKDRHSVRKVVVVESKEHRSPVTEEILRLVLEGLGIEFEIRPLKLERSRIFLRELRRSKPQAVIFPSGTLASSVSYQNPDGMVELFGSLRVALMEGPIDLPVARTSGAQVDVVTFNWRSVAESIVNDLITLEAYDHSRHTLLEAEAHLRIPVSSFGVGIQSTIQ
jgi:hypothetical protein